MKRRLLVTRTMIPWHFKYLDEYFRKVLDVKDSKICAGDSKKRSDSFGAWLIDDPTKEQMMIIAEHGMDFEEKSERFVLGAGVKVVKKASTTQHKVDVIDDDDEVESGDI